MNVTDISITRAVLLQLIYYESEIVQNNSK